MRKYLIAGLAAASLSTSALADITIHTGRWDIPDWAFLYLIGKDSQLRPFADVRNDVQRRSVRQNLGGRPKALLHRECDPKRGECSDAVFTFNKAEKHFAAHVIFAMVSRKPSGEVTERRLCKANWPQGDTRTCYDYDRNQIIDAMKD